MSTLPSGSARIAIAAGTLLITPLLAATAFAAPALATGAGETGTISGRIWNDANGNGHQDAGEKGLQGVKLVLSSNGPAGVVKAIATKVTGADGAYEFTGLAPSDGPAGETLYSVLAGAPDKNWKLTEANADGSNATDSDFQDASFIPVGSPERKQFPAGVALAYVDRIGVLAGKTVDYDGGFLTPSSAPAKGTISGRIWNDANGNGRQDKGEKGIAGVDVRLVKSEDDGASVYRRGTTGADGRYTFTNADTTQKPGWDYSVAAAVPKGSKLTSVGVAGDTEDSDLMPFDWPRARKIGGFFPQGTVVGIVDHVELRAGETKVVDGGYTKAGETLPVTGASTDALFGGGAALVLSGIALLALCSRRRSFAPSAANLVA